MKKEIYKEVPASFHKQLCRTLDQLEECPGSGLLFRKKHVLLLAAAVLACASVTVAAVGLMEWHHRTSERFGTDKELEDQLTMDGAVMPQSAVVERDNLKFQAIQSVRTEDYYYFLLQVTIPENIQWNDDILFEECSTADPQFGCVANFVADSLEDHSVLLELQIHPDTEWQEQGELIVVMKNLVQTEKTAVTDRLVEGEWEIPLILPSSEAGTVSFYPEQSVRLGEHELYFTKVEVNPFEIRLYTDEEAGMHAVWGHSVTPFEVWYEDGTVLEENGMPLSMSGHKEEAGDFYFGIPLENAVDTERIAGLSLLDGGEEREISLNLSAASEPKEERQDASVTSIDFPEDQKISDVRLLYVRYDNAVLTDGQTVWLWDAVCGRAQELFQLRDYGFSFEDGGEISMGQGSQMLFLPYKECRQVYLYDISSKEMVELDTETFWPWPVQESYQSCIEDTVNLYANANERYSRQSFSFQGKWYCLYSDDGLMQNMELKVLE